MKDGIDIGIYMDLNDEDEEKDLKRCFPEWDLGVQ